MSLEWPDKKADINKGMTSAFLPAFSKALGRTVNLSLGASVAFVGINLLLLGAGLLAFRQNMRLRVEIAHDEAMLVPAKGTLIPALVGKDRTGATATMAFGEDRRPTLFYSFTAHCPFCLENWRAMRTVQALAPKSLRIIYIDTAPDKLTPEYLTWSGIGQSVVVVRLLPPVAAAYEARAVPQTLLADSDGRVQWAHMGELSTSDVSTVVALVKGE